MASLAACAKQDSAASAPPCPNIIIVKDTSELTAFRPGPGRDLTDVVFDAKLGRYAGDCETSLEKDRTGTVSVDLKLFFEATRGPANDTREGKFSYYVAVAKRGGEILAKKVFDAGLKFEGNRNRVGVMQELSQEIPLHKDQLGEDFDIYVGFQLTPEQLQFNRGKVAR